MDEECNHNDMKPTHKCLDNQDTTTMVYCCRQCGEYVIFVEIFGGIFIKVNIDE